MFVVSVSWNVSPPDGSSQRPPPDDLRTCCEFDPHVDAVRLPHLSSLGVWELAWGVLVGQILAGPVLVTSLLAGVVALLAPCCVSVMLPAYLSTVFRRAPPLSPRAPSCSRPVWRR